MNWKQTIGLIIGVSALVALCFLVVFPALYDKDEPEKKAELKKEAASTTEDDRTVLPKLKGVNWKTAPEAGKPVEKKVKRVAKKKTPIPLKEKEADVEETVAVETGPTPLLELQELAWYEQEGYVVVVGVVKNISNTSLPTVQAHVTFQGDGGWFISEEHAMIELNPIFPNQISPFTVVSRYYAEITNAVVDFRTFSGESIPSRQVEIEEADAEEGQVEGEVEVEIEDGVPAAK